MGTKYMSDKDNKYINLKSWDRVKLFLYRRFNLKLPQRCWSKRDKLIKLTQESKQKLDREFDMLKIIKNLRDLRILMQSKFLNGEIVNKIKNNPRNLIVLSDESLEMTND